MMKDTEQELNLADLVNITVQGWKVILVVVFIFVSSAYF